MKTKTIKTNIMIGKTTVNVGQDSYRKCGIIYETICIYIFYITIITIIIIYITILYI